MRRSALLATLATAPLAAPLAASAEGIALGNPLAGASLGLLWGLPLAGVVVSAIVMLACRPAALLGAFGFSAAFAGALFLMGMAGMSNHAAVFWIAAMVLSPWVFFLVFAIHAFLAMRSLKGEPPEKAE